MDYIETFKTNGKNYIAAQSIKISKSPSSTQRKYEFNQALKLKTQELEKYLSEQAENWENVAAQNGQIGIKPSLINEIRTLLREFKSNQIDILESIEGE